MIGGKGVFPGKRMGKENSKKNLNRLTVPFGPFMLSRVYASEVAVFEPACNSVHVRNSRGFIDE